MSKMFCSYQSPCLDVSLITCKHENEKLQYELDEFMKNKKSDDCVLWGV
uniref:Uncharacterized protein n=1 Tax=Rhizophora mucronata TaxID=61149 RepID=A0A2P2KLG4_RHIMU